MYSVFSTNWGWNAPEAGTWYTTFYNADIKSYWVRSMLVTDVLTSGLEADLQGFSWGRSTWLGYTETAYSKIRYVTRARELYAEGVRRQDLIRHGQFISNAVERGFAAQPHMVLFPIPSNVIIEGEGTIEQNPGYN